MISYYYLYPKSETGGLCCFAANFLMSIQSVSWTAEFPLLLCHYRFAKDQCCREGQVSRNTGRRFAELKMCLIYFGVNNLGLPLFSTNGFSLHKTPDSHDHDVRISSHVLVFIVFHTKHMCIKLCPPRFLHGMQIRSANTSQKVHHQW